MTVKETNAEHKSPCAYANALMWLVAILVALCGWGMSRIDTLAEGAAERSAAIASIRTEQQWVKDALLRIETGQKTLEQLLRSGPSGAN